MEYLGHINSTAGVATDPVKVQAVQDWPVPRNIKQLRGFLGLAGYYRRFIKNYGLISKPLKDLLWKWAFTWSPEATAAFDHLKHSLVITLFWPYLISGRSLFCKLMPLARELGQY